MRDFLDDGNAIAFFPSHVGEDRGIACASLAEAEIIAGDNMGGVQSVDEHIENEFRRLTLGHRRIKGKGRKNINTERSEQPCLGAKRRQAEERFVGKEKLFGMRFKHQHAERRIKFPGHAPRFIDDHLMALVHTIKIAKRIDAAL